MNNLLSNETRERLEIIDAAVADLCENLGINYQAARTEIFDGGGEHIVDEKETLYSIEKGIRAAIESTQPVRLAVPEDFRAPTAIVSAVRRINVAFNGTAPIVNRLSGNSTMKKEPTVDDVVDILDQFDGAIRQRGDAFDKMYERAIAAEAKCLNYERDIDAVRRVFGL
jgi:hypothetical protein